MYDSAESSNDNLSTLAIDRKDFEVDDDLASNGRGDGAPRMRLGLVPDRNLVSGWGVILPDVPEVGICAVLSCAADAEGRSRRGVIEPLMSAVMSSPLAEGPDEVK